MAIGHNRYSTAGGNNLKNVQPLTVNFAFGNLALAHNGNLINATMLRHELEAYGAIFQSTIGQRSHHPFDCPLTSGFLLPRMIDALSQVRGAFSVVLMTDTRRDRCARPHGLRPLCLGKVAR